MEREKDRERERNCVPQIFLENELRERVRERRRKREGEGGDEEWKMNECGMKETHEKIQDTNNGEEEKMEKKWRQPKERARKLKID